MKSKLTETRTFKTLAPLDSPNLYDVCIIGSGPAGTTIAQTLVKRGLKVLILESGKNIAGWLFDKRFKRMASYECSGTADYPLKNTRGRLLGGTSNFWTGRCTRLHSSDFEPNPYTPDGNPWPITYTDIDPYYEQAEKTLRVRGDHLSDLGPPRKHPLPLPLKGDLSGLKSLLADVGITADCSPTATPAKGFRLFRVQEEILPDFLGASNLTLIVGANVTRLLTGIYNEIIGAEVHSVSGERKIARAKTYIIAGGGIETPRLLLYSKSESFSDGLGNLSGLVGKGFNDHPAVNFFGSVRHTKSTLSPFPKIVRSHQYYDAFRPEGLGSVLLVFRQAWAFPHHNLPLLGLSKLSNLPIAIKSFFGRIAKPTLYIGATIEQNLVDSNRVTLSQKEVDPFGKPLAHLHLDYSEKDLKTLERSRELILNIYQKLGATGVKEAENSWSRHHQSTCRMGDDPTKSVVDRNLRVHGMKNLYACGSEVFVTGGAMQPCLTIVALAHRLADHLLG